MNKEISIGGEDSDVRFPTRVLNLGREFFNFCLSDEPASFVDSLSKCTILRREVFFAVFALFLFQMRKATDKQLAFTGFLPVSVSVLLYTAIVSTRAPIKFGATFTAWAIVWIEAQLRDGGVGTSGKVVDHSCNMLSLIQRHDSVENVGSVSHGKHSLMPAGSILGEAIKLAPEPMMQSVEAVA